MIAMFCRLLLVVLPGQVLGPAAPAAEPPDRPNILFIMSDDHAAHAIGAYGSAVNQTPGIDRIAREGMLFENCFCENALCTPSRAAIMTGTFSCRSGVVDLSARLDPSLTTIPMLLKPAGYQTAIVGKWHLNREPTEFDFWEVLPGQGLYHDPEFLTTGGRIKTTGYVTDLITDKCIQWLERRDQTKPFLLCCHHKAPHRSWEPDDKHAALYADGDIPEPATFDDDYGTRCDAARRQKMSVEHDLRPFDVGAEPPQGLDARERKRWHYQQYMQRYLRCVASVDENVARLLAYLDTSGLAPNTIVIYTSDQGFFLGDHGWYDKRFMYEEALRMPLLVRFPGRIAPGASSDRLVQNVDFAPTILDFAGVAVPAEMQGRSIRPILEGLDVPVWRDAIYYHYFEEGTEHRVAAHYGLRTDRYKLIRFCSEVKAWEFYDLREDPRELRNVHADPAYAEVVADLTRRLEAMQTDFGDSPLPRSSRAAPPEPAVAK